MKHSYLPRHIQPGLLLVELGVFLLTVLVYTLGLTGGFYLDDFAQILYNPYIRDVRVEWHSLEAALRTSSAGPTGRPVAMLTFALDRLLDDLDPWWMKLVNLTIHLGNGLLLYTLLRRLLPKLTPAMEGNAPIAALLLSALWLLHPLHVSAVLYVVQRMTLLSAFFMLLGLLGYWRFRCQARPKLPLALGSLGAATLIATLAKENGVLAFAYAALLELFVLRFHGLDINARRLLQALFLWLPLVGVGVLGLYWMANPDWFAHAYAHRDFNVTERLLTQARALAFYQRLILLPDISAMGLYHDDFPLSHGLFDPPTAFAAILWHGALLTCAWKLRTRVPAFAFGIAWFYASHLLESTVIPLEMVFEHRNYLAVAGLLIALYGLLIAATQSHRLKPHIIPWLLGGLTALFTVVTAIRAADWGDFYGHALMEAERHPRSARSQFEAAQTLARGISRNAKLITYYDRVRNYYWNSTHLAPRSLAPLVGLMNLDAAVTHRLDDQVITELRRRLRHEKPLPSAGLNLHALIKQILEDDHHVFSKEIALSLFDAALANPKLGARNRAEILVGKALYLNGQDGDLAEIVSLMTKATNLRPGNANYWLLLAGFQIDAGKIGEAMYALKKAKVLDPYGVLQNNIRHLQRQIQFPGNISEHTLSPPAFKEH